MQNKEGLARAPHEFQAVAVALYCFISHIQKTELGQYQILHEVNDDRAFHRSRTFGLEVVRHARGVGAVDVASVIPAVRDAGPRQSSKTLHVVPI